MDWKNHFYPTILTRGRQYFQRGQVKELSFRNQTYTAKVMGSRTYRVVIRMRGDDVASMGCTCPHAESGNHCKHMAAVMYAIEQREKMSQSPEVKPFSASAEQEEYQYFDMGRIADGFVFFQEQLAGAMQLVKKQTVILDEVKTRYTRFTSGTVLCGYAYGSYRGTRDSYPLSIVFDRDRIVRASCGVPRCGKQYESYYYWEEKEVCQHLLALMILLDQYLKKYNPGDSTDQEGAFIFNKYRDQHVIEVLGQNVTQQEDLKLEPV